MSEMIERVARGMHLRRPNSRLTKWEDCSDEYRTGTMRDARAAIAAMREPDDKMRIAGAHVHDQRPSEAAATFAAMIDAALTPAKVDEAIDDQR